MPTRKERKKQEIADCKFAIKTSIEGSTNHSYFTVRLAVLEQESKGE